MCLAHGYCFVTNFPAAGHAAAVQAGAAVVAYATATELFLVLLLPDDYFFAGFS